MEGTETLWIELGKKTETNMGNLPRSDPFPSSLQVRPYTFRSYWVYFTPVTSDKIPNVKKVPTSRGQIVKSTNSRWTSED